ncbi:hypothetical protein GKC30_13260 [Pseudodesulfovibrio sp. F-1]|uniref:Flippase-like domain-containing protein n=1 Tax=Pseudodesulfovibrio alkaliphilus TaxID=2661613 RepID=A0A7K1KRP7_9BACT|nr:lysylphosphatidylglycerol synthase domain-containing protein [Pseudodesulfovibrio alkaliphilus]MUM78602.1 hypothetical protein [Pseudodesulfovibrio alkaliphilus]
MTRFRHHRYWRPLAVVAKVGLPPVVLIWLAWTLTVDQRFSGLRFDWPMAVLAVALYIGALFSNAFRLSLVVRSLCGRLKVFEAWRICLQSAFYFVFVPLSAGFDVARFAKISALDSGLKRPSIIGALLIDRLLGLSVPLVVFTVLIAWPGLLPQIEIAAETQWALLGALAVLCCIGLLLLSRFTLWKDIDGLLRSLVHNSSSLLTALGWTVSAHTCLYASVWCLALSLGINAPLLYIVVGCVCGLILQIVPLNVGGLGAGEAAGVFVYSFLGFAMHDAVLLALLPYLFRVGTAVCGGIWEWLNGIRHARAAFK